MIVVMKIDATPQDGQAIFTRLGELGLRGQTVTGVQREVIAVLGQVFPELRDELSTMEGVDEVIRISKPYKLASREVHDDDTIVHLNYGVKVGGGHPVV